MTRVHSLSDFTWALVCPPRSGSNFLQALLGRCTDMAQGAFYEPPTTPRPGVLLKSHAVSYVHLLNELGCFFPGPARLPAKVIVLWRHPLYALLSAFAYHQYQHGSAHSLEDYLQRGWTLYECGLAGCSYLERSEEFVANWKVTSHNVLQLRYEEVVLEPEAVIGKVCAFFEVRQTASPTGTILASLSEGPQRRWQNPEEPIAGTQLPLHIRQYPAEFPDPDRRSDTWQQAYKATAALCGMLGYDIDDV